MAGLGSPVALRAGPSEMYFRELVRPRDGVRPMSNARRDEYTLTMAVEFGANGALAAEGRTAGADLCMALLAVRERCIDDSRQTVQAFAVHDA